MQKNNVTIIVIVALIFAAGGFFGGMKYQESKTPSFAGRTVPGGQFPGGAQGDRQVPEGGQLRQQNFSPVSGEIVSIDEGSITVSMPDGSSKIVLLTDTTSVNKTEEGSESDLIVGEQVMIIGSQNSDGSVTAQNVSIGGERGFFGEPEAN